MLHPFPYPIPIGSSRLEWRSRVRARASLHRDAVARRLLRLQEDAELRPGRRRSDLGNRNVSGGDEPERLFTALLLDDPFEVIGMGRPGAGLSAGRVGTERATGRDHQPSHLAEPLRRGSPDRRTRDPDRRSGRYGCRRDAARPASARDGSVDSVERRSIEAAAHQSVCTTVSRRLGPGSALKDANAELPRSPAVSIRSFEGSFAGA